MISKSLNPLEHNMSKGHRPSTAIQTPPSGLLQDDDFVGETRQVLVLGADLQTVQPDEPMPPVHPYADVGRPPSRPLKGESDDEGPPRPQPYSVRSRVHEELEAAPRVNDLPQTPMPPPPPQLQPKPTPKPKPKPVPRPPQEYEITIKHAVEPGAVGSNRPQGPQNHTQPSLSDCLGCSG